MTQKVFSTWRSQWLARHINHRHHHYRLLSETSLICQDNFDKCVAMTTKVATNMTGRDATWCDVDVKRVPYHIRAVMCMICMCVSCIYIYICIYVYVIIRIRIVMIIIIIPIIIVIIIIIIMCITITTTITIIHIYIYIYTHTRIHTYTYIHMYVCIYIYIYMYSYIYIYIMYVPMHIYIYIYIYCTHIHDRRPKLIDKGIHMKPFTAALAGSLRDLCGNPSIPHVSLSFLSRNIRVSYKSMVCRRICLRPRLRESCGILSGPLRAPTFYNAPYRMPMCIPLTFTM